MTSMWTQYFVRCKHCKNVRNFRISISNKGYCDIVHFKYKFEVVLLSHAQQTLKLLMKYSFSGNLRKKQRRRRNKIWRKKDTSSYRIFAVAGAASLPNVSIFNLSIFLNWRVFKSLGLMRLSSVLPDCLQKCKWTLRLGTSHVFVTEGRGSILLAKPL